MSFLALCHLVHENQIEDQANPIQFSPAFDFLKLTYNFIKIPLIKKFMFVVFIQDVKILVRNKKLFPGIRLGK